MARKVAYRKKRQNRLSMILVAIMVIMVIVLVAVRMTDLDEKVKANQDRMDELQIQMEAENARTEELAEFEKRTKTKQYMEEVAEDRLGLVHEGEIIFKQEN